MIARDLSSPTTVQWLVVRTSRTVELAQHADVDPAGVPFVRGAGCSAGRPAQAEADPVWDHCGPLLGQQLDPDRQRSVQRNRLADHLHETQVGPLQGKTGGLRTPSKSDAEHTG